jgi:myo-inositol-1(or 4)-monophosphatase
VTDLDLHELCAVAQRAARAGGAIVAKHFGGPLSVREKAPGDWVSEADLASEAAVCEILERETGIPVHGEEAGGTRNDLEWLVDPLDGTANFVHGFDAVGVSVGLVRDNEPIVGVVHAPLLGGDGGRMYDAVKGGGARCDGRPIHVSARAPEQAIIATGFPFRHKELLPEHLAVFEPALVRFEDVRRVGAASLDLCWVAQGTFDGYFELRLGPWDVAAGALVVREAGGVVTDWSADPADWLASGNIVAASPGVHGAILRLTDHRP